LVKKPLEKAKEYLDKYEEHKGGTNWRDGAIAWALWGIGNELQVIATELGNVRIKLSSLIGIEKSLRDREKDKK